MIKTLIADSDIENINSFKTYIRKNFPLFKVERPAMTIKDFYKLVSERQPSLIILEMKFFGAGTLQNVKNLNSQYPDIKIILYGTIAENEYMKKCMDYGVIAFMFRPVKPSEFSRCLNEAMKIFEKQELINKQQQNLIEDYQNNISSFEIKFLETVLSGKIKNDYEISMGFDYFGIDIKNPPYTAVILRIDHFKKFVLALEEREKHLMIFQMLKVVEENLPNSKAFMYSFNEIAIIISEVSELDDIVDMVKRVQTEIKSIIEIDDISFGIGRKTEFLSKLVISFNEANAALRYRSVLGYGSIIPIEYAEPESKITYEYPIERENLLVQMAIVGDLDYSIQLTYEITESLRKYEPLPQGLLYQIIMNILISISRYCGEKGIVVSEMSKYFPSSVVLSLKSIDEARVFLEDGLKQFCDYIQKLREKQENEIFRKAKDYIDNFYYETINNAKMAQITNCPIEYFKKIFITKSEKNVADYVSYVRIQEAKKLILETNLTDDIIAIKVGYNDMGVFKNVFKQIEGYLVSDFRYLNSKR